MSYTKEFIQSPNFTPNAQVRAAYGRPRTIEFGAGHWWGLPTAGYQHQGIINTFLNAARQASAHAIVSAGRVTEMVRDQDVAWATNNANPFTFSIEVDPRIMLGGATAEAIMATLAEYIADKGYHNLQWKPHNTWWSTQCNPIDWGEVMRRAKAVVAARNQPVIPEWKKNLRKIDNVTLFAIDDNTPLRNLASTAQVIKNFAKGTSFEIAAITRVGDYEYYLTKYAYENNTGQGFDLYELKTADAPKPVQPEWIRNLKDIAPVKLQVLPAQTPIVHLETLAVIKQLGQGTWVDFVKTTTVNGVEYLLSSYSATNTMPNGIKRADVGLPVVVPEEPVKEKPEWLKNWKDIVDETMYTRSDANLVNLLDGSTIKVIPRGTAVEIASATEWHGQEFLITKYSTEKEEARGIALSDLDKKPTLPVVVTDPIEEDPTAPDPVIITDPSVLERLNWLEKAVKAIQDFLASIFTGFKK